MTIQQHEELLKKVKDLQEENIHLKKRKKYGLVWEDKPEIFDEQSKNALPILIEKDGRFNDTISDPDGDFNILIEGDNYHSLSVLKYTHRNSVDVIYADPPYNTGSTDWKYNNNYVDKEDSFRHSKWLSFMDKRLRIAKDLLKDSGMICVAIDDYEIHTLGMLLADIFGEENKIGLLAIRHHPRGRTQSNFFSTTHEYALFYAKDISKVKSDFCFSTDEKEEVDSLIRSREDATPETRPNLYYPLYVSGKGGVSITKDKIHKFEIYPKNRNGDRVWKLVKDSLQEEMNENLIFAKKSSGEWKIYRKITRGATNKAKTLWVDPSYDANSHGTNLLKKIFNENTFNFPKSIHTVKDIITLLEKRIEDPVILDFFAGSGTTGHAVLELNKEDGGNRKFILCTNNENKICEEVTYERIKRVSQGYKNKKGEDVEGLGGNLKYLKTDFIQIDNSIDDLKEKIVEASTQILCLKEATFKQKDIQEKIKIFESSNQYTAILFDTFYLKEFTEVLNKLTDKKVSVYVFAYDKNFSKEEFHNLSQAVEYTVEPIPEKLLETYQEIFNF